MNKSHYSISDDLPNAVVLPKSRPNTAGVSPAFDINTPIKFVDVNEKGEIIKPAPEPEPQSVLTNFGINKPKRVKVKKVEKPIMSTQVEPGVKIKFSGAFGELETYYFDVSIQNNMLVLVWNTEYRGSRYTPPMTTSTTPGVPGAPITVTLADKVYNVYNYNIKVVLDSVKLEILLLPIAPEEEVDEMQDED